MLRIGLNRVRPLVVAGLALSLCAPAAWATYPGRNGQIVVMSNGGWHYLHQAYWLNLIDGRGQAEPGYMRVCNSPERTEGPPYCFALGAASLSPDGTEVATPVFEQFDSEEPTLMFRVPLDGAPVASSPITAPVSWLGIGWDEDGTP